MGMKVQRLGAPLFGFLRCRPRHAFVKASHGDINPFRRFLVPTVTQLRLGVILR